MKSASPALISLLASSETFLMAELFTFTLVNGEQYRWTTADIDLVYGGNTYKSGSSLIKRGTIKNVIGVEVDTLAITLSPSQNDYIGNIRLSNAILNVGFFDAAKVELRKVFLTDFASPPLGDLILFMGKVSDIVGTGTQIEISVKSKMETLNAQVPRNLYQASCINSVYDPICQANKSAVTASGSISSGTTSSVNTNVYANDGYYNQGVLTFTSGANSGIKRTVKSYLGRAFTFALPLPSAPSAGDTFTVFPGCDNTMSTCSNKFGNLIHFRGMPYVPVPETSI